MSRGILVVLEGIDQCGKSSASVSVCQKLNSEGIKSVTQPFPDRSTAVGKLIDDFLHGKNLPQQAVHLLYSANRWEVAKIIEKNINEGVTVVCDRYAFSGIVYSIANGLDPEWCKIPDSGLPKPDIVCFLELSLDEADRRRKSLVADRYENVEFQKKVKSEFEKMKNELLWTSVDANQNRKKVVEDICNIIKKNIKEMQSNPIGKLTFK
ncbi:thymidylate kinase, putative [Entamoeba invadens IP1]|uniref:Thymidylate kinase n=1 Tax=Entamoeba invadens IP1 TaxID=370355 RepID=A0A0A1UGF9_ENTIV|nr:thymidylate kinase, putative [Entamoeba invadens IP1]ELP92632.1 thymidylate kinase, putative [Entamoeba invadens IP1]|eukprot:XP_004259403.1 thymidylate kinase, putative [Entamoeba invadens IP1]